MVAWGLHFLHSLSAQALSTRPHRVCRCQSLVAKPFCISQIKLEVLKQGTLNPRGVKMKSWKNERKRRYRRLKMRKDISEWADQLKKMYCSSFRIISFIGNTNEPESN